MRVFCKDCVFSGTKKQAENGTKVAVYKLCIGRVISISPVEDTVSGQQQHTCCLTHTRPAQHRHSAQDGRGTSLGRGNQLFHKLIQLKPAGHSEMFGAGRLFPIWKGQFSFSERRKQAKAAPRQPSCPPVGSLPEGREICIPARDWLPQSCFAAAKSARQQAKNSPRCGWARHCGGAGARLGRREGPRHAQPSRRDVTWGHGAPNALRVPVGLFQWLKEVLQSFSFQNKTNC